MILILGWFLLGLLGSGFMFAEHDSYYGTNYRENLGFSLLFSIFGPVGLVISFFTTGFGQHGWRLWPKEK